MTETEEILTSAANQKRKIRRRYQGIDSDMIEKIPAALQRNFFEDDSPKQVAVYARVSTDDPRQTSSYELQKNHYRSLIDRHSGWNLIQIYADEGISGTSLAHRDAFLQMIEDCINGKIDLILVKSVARFARNIVDCISYSRQLASLSPPVGIFFEAENLYTLSPDGEMRLSFLAAMAQEESRSKSEIMNTSIEMRFGIGIFLTPTLLGYDHDSEGNLIINEEEANTVRLIFFMYLYGYTCREIADTMTKLKRKTKAGNTAWAPGSILKILQNERHCGDVLARKTWTPNYLDHRSRKNKMNRNQYRQNNHHEPIIARDDFLAVQKLIRNSKYGHKGFLPKLHAVSDGMLRGFVTVNPRWAGFSADDYRRTSSEIFSPEESKPVKSPFLPGTFDLRKFKVARAQFFNNTDRIAVTCSCRKIVFSAVCIRKFNTDYVKLLVHPAGGWIAAVPAKETEKCAVRWSRIRQKNMRPRPISGAAFLPNLYQLFSFHPDQKYRIIGFEKQCGTECALIFDVKDAETLISNQTEDQEASIQKMTPSEKGVRPNSFGDNYYRQMQTQELVYFEKNGQWDNPSCGQTHHSAALHPTNPTIIAHSIEELISKMKSEASNERTK